VFNRIHVADLAQIIDKAVDRALGRRAGGVFNAPDDEPTAPADPILFAASLLGVAPPAEIAFEEAKKTMTPFAVSFYGESKRVRNERVKVRARRFASHIRRIARVSGRSQTSPSRPGLRSELRRYGFQPHHVGPAF